MLDSAIVDSYCVIDQYSEYRDHLGIHLVRTRNSPKN